MSAALFSVIIPNWNGARFLPTCLGALQRQSYRPLEVIVVDNASTDGSQAYIREQHPEVRLIALEENRGFTGACNVGFEAARGEYMALLNNDTEVDSGWAAAIVDAFERHPEVGIVASKILLFDRRDHIHTTGDYFTTDGRAGNRGIWERDRGQYDEEGYVFGACGGAAAYRRSLLEQIGLLDDDFFFLLEDIDISWRAQLTGWRVLYTPQAIVYHHLSATGGGEIASYYDGRNGIYILVKNVPSALWRRHGRRFIGRQLRLAWEAMRAWRGAAARARLRGMWAGIRHLPRLLKKRREIQSMRTVSIDYLESILTASGERRER